MNLIILLVIATVFLVTVELAKRKLLIQANITRKISHIGAASIAVVSPLFVEKDLIVIACLIFAALMFFSRRLSFFSSIHSVKRNTAGEVFLPLGEAFTALIFLPQSIIAFQYGVLVMGVSDALAGLVGEKYGKHRINLFNNKKSIEGTVTFFLVTLIITFLSNPGIGLYLVLLPLSLTLIELVCGYGSDNLVLPIAGATLLHFYLY